MFAVFGKIDTVRASAEDRHTCLVERLCELELPYRLRNMGRTKAGDFIPPVVRRRLMPRYAHAGRNRKALAERTGMVQVPYLYDPNTDTGLYESDAIIAYLTETYAA